MKTQNNTALPSVAELQKLTPAQAAVDFVKQTTAAVRAFIVAAKLLIVLEPTLKPGQTLGAQIIKLANVPADLRRRVKSTIDNGRYAMRVWKELVVSGHVKESTFDTFTFGDMVSINRVMSGASRQKLSAADVAIVMESSPDTWHEELDSFYTYGQSCEDRKAAEAKAAAKKTTNESTTETTTTESPTEASPTDAQGDDVGASPDAPKAETAHEPVAAGKIVAMPAQQSKPTAEKVFELVSAIEVLLTAMDTAEVAKCAPAIAELNATVQASLTEAKPKAKAKKAAKKAA